MLQTERAALKVKCQAIESAAYSEIAGVLAEDGKMNDMIDYVGHSLMVHPRRLIVAKEMQQRLAEAREQQPAKVG